MEKEELAIAYNKSLQVLRDCSTKKGFKALPESEDRYNRIWGRDSMICSLAALLSEETDLIEQARKSLLTLMEFQHELGQIPSNVDTKHKKVSYGKIAGRVDSILWFLIGFSQYVKKTGDNDFLKKHYPSFTKAMKLVYCYEFNGRGLIYVPRGGDWADEYVQEGYVLYDELLYYQAIKEDIFLRKKLKKNTKEQKRKLKDLKEKILTNYDLTKKSKDKKKIYHLTLYEQTQNDKKYKKPYLLSYFNPSRYSDKFDGFANSLALNIDILSRSKRKEINNYIKLNFSKKTSYLIPSFYPIIKKGLPDWDELKRSYLQEFRNKPHEYHNGGLWPVVNGFYAAALSKDDRGLALRYLEGINKANKSENWSFPEFLNFKTKRPNGKKHLGWSAAAGVIGYQAVINKKQIFAE